MKRLITRCPIGQSNFGITASGQTASCFASLPQMSFDARQDRMESICLNDEEFVVVEPDTGTETAREAQRGMDETHTSGNDAKVEKSVDLIQLRMTEIEQKLSQLRHHLHQTSSNTSITTTNNNNNNNTDFKAQLDAIMTRLVALELSQTQQQLAQSTLQTQLTQYQSNPLAPSDSVGLSASFLATPMREDGEVPLSVLFSPNAKIQWGSAVQLHQLACTAVIPPHLPSVPASMSSMVMKQQHYTDPEPVSILLTTKSTETSGPTTFVLQNVLKTDSVYALKKRVESLLFSNNHGSDHQNERRVKLSMCIPMATQLSSEQSHHANGKSWVELIDRKYVGEYPIGTLSQIWVELIPKQHQKQH